MKHILLICNYFEGRTGHLEKCLNSWCSQKKENVKICIIDNGSKDESLEIISRFVKERKIDYSIFNAKNVGKPKALNNLFKFIYINEGISNDDLIYSIDSDIEILDNVFIDKMEKLFFHDKNIGLVSVDMKNEDNEYPYHTFNKNENEKYVYDNNEYYKVLQQNGICGALFVIPVKDFISVGMYAENTGKNRASAIYGGDDAILELMLYTKFREKIHLVGKNILAMHPKSDVNYFNWKVNENKNMCSNGFGNSTLSEKGFYDNE